MYSPMLRRASLGDQRIVIVAGEGGDNREREPVAGDS